MSSFDFLKYKDINVFTTQIEILITHRVFYFLHNFRTLRDYHFIQDVMCYITAAIALAILLYSSFLYTLFCVIYSGCRHGKWSNQD